MIINEGSSSNKYRRENSSLRAVSLPRHDGVGAVSSGCKEPHPDSCCLRSQTGASACCAVSTLRLQVHKFSRVETCKYRVRFFVLSVCVSKRDGGHVFFLLANQDLSDCEVLPFLADDLFPVEEGYLQVKTDFSFPAGCSKCSQANHEKLSQTLNANACCLCSGADPRS